MIINDKIVWRGGTYRSDYPKLLVKFYEDVQPYTLQHNNVTGKMEKVANDYPTLTKFRIAHQIPKSTWDNRAKNYPELAEAIELVKDMREEFLTQNGLNGTYNAQMAKFIGMNDLGMSEKKEVQNNTTSINPEQTRKMMMEAIEDWHKEGATEVEVLDTKVIDEQHGGVSEEVGPDTASERTS